MDNRGIDQDPGWINRQLRELRQAIEALRSERRASATTVSEGDFVVSGGGGIVIRDGGELTTYYPNSTTVATTLGTPGGAVEIALRHATIPADIFSVYAYAPTPGNPNGSSQATLNVQTIDFNATDRIQIDGDDFQMSAGNSAFPGMFLRTDVGPLELQGPSGIAIPTHPTTSNSANMYIDSINGQVYRSTSARKYKQDIADHDIDPLAVLKMRPRTWRDRAEVEKDPDVTQRYIGFIAEELHDLGLTEFVSYDEQGRPDAVAYDRIPVALLIALRWLTKQVRDERARTDALEAKVVTQQQQIDALTARLDALSGPTTPPTTTRST